MGINEVIVWILMICMVLGGLDRAIGNRFGLGEKFEDGINAMGPLALSMVGVYALSPILAKILGVVIRPVYEFLGADPAMFAGTLLANDMGGWPLAQALTDNPDAQKLSGLVLGAMMGATIVFTIPVALGMINKEDRGFLARGGAGRHYHNPNRGRGLWFGGRYASGMGVASDGADHFGRCLDRSRSLVQAGRHDQRLRSFR